MKHLSRSLPTLAVVLSLAIVGGIGVVSYLSFVETLEREDKINSAHEVLLGIERVISLLKDVETAGRGFVLTGNEQFLEPYGNAVPSLDTELAALHRAILDPGQQRRLELLAPLAAERMAIANRVILLKQTDRRSGAAEALIGSGVGKAVMDRVRVLIDEMGQAERNRIRTYNDHANASAWRTSAIFLTGYTVSVVILILSFVSLKREIRERMRAHGEIVSLNATLREHSVQLEAANKGLDAFSYTIAHDLRSPLRAVSGFAQALVEDYSDKLDAEGRQMLADVVDSGKKMSRLIEDLLAFSRLGRMPIARAEVDMAALARNVFVEIGNNIPSAVPQFEMNPLPPAWGDATLLRLVWLNLLSNAVKYSGKVQHPAVEIGGHIDGGEAIFYVKDNGTGFDMKYYDKLFRVFHRLHREEEYEGTGIGLATVQQVVTKHGGRVWGQGEVGRGATFYFTLPTGGDHG